MTTKTSKTPSPRRLLHKQPHENRQGPNLPPGAPHGDLCHLMKCRITGTGEGESLKWEVQVDKSETEDTVIIEHVRSSQGTVVIQKPEHREQGLQAFREALRDSRANWITPDLSEWILDLDRLKSAFPALARLDWLTGKVPLEPQFEWGETFYSQQNRAYLRQIERSYPSRFQHPEQFSPCNQAYYESRVWFVLSPGAVQRKVIVFESPPEIQDSLRRLQRDFPRPKKTGFIIMRFEEGKAYTLLVHAIKAGLRHHDLEGVRADERQYNDKLFENVLTLMHGCGFGIAVFDHAEKEAFNPNVAFEVGYLLAMGKPVCLLKDSRLQSLPTDLIGRLYTPFDARDPARSIARELTSWLRKNELA